MVVYGFFSSKRKHLLVLTLRIILYYYMVMMNSELYLTTFFLSFAVCEGALGLSIFLWMICSHENDYFTSFGLLQC